MTAGSLFTFGQSRLLGLHDAAVFNFVLQTAVAIYGCSLYRKVTLARSALDALGNQGVGA
jgi:hypothetical protein